MIDSWLATDLDAWTRRVVARNFAPETGSPYWLARATELDFDPRDITRYDQLPAFGPFRLDALRSGRSEDVVPRDIPRPLVGRIYESGGTTGLPCRVFYTPEMIRHRGAWRRWSFVIEGFEPGRTWLQATPTGPHLIGHGMTELSELYGCLVHAIDMDSRWVKRLIRDNRLADVVAYTDHVVEQIVDCLETQHIDHLNTTPALLSALIARRPDLVRQVRGVRLSGTQVSQAQYREFVEAVDGPVGLSYGNTFGSSAGLPPEDDGATMPYVPNYPQVTTTVVDPDDWRTVLPVGARGRVRLTILHDDLFLPNLLERDQATCWNPPGRWPSPGVANVAPLHISRNAPEGLY
ncbi:MAG TPA: hypothetical protein VH141_16620 [Pseudonocardia sp.]|nr:hypothetical protein [Pseudonocardia sp.]